MKIYVEERVYQTSGQTDVFDLTTDIEDILSSAGLSNGLLTIITPGSTATITTIEFESGVIQDLKQAVERLIPTGLDYAHDLRWGDGNGYSHVRAAIMGPSLSVPIISGKYCLGTWQQVVCIDFDNRPRTRRVVFQMMGTA